MIQYFTTVASSQQFQKLVYTRPELDSVDFLWYVPYEGPDWGMSVIYSKGAIMKQKLSIDELITHMKNKGIKFDIVSAQDARKSLTHNNCKYQ